MNKVFLGNYKENEYDVLMKITQMIRNNSYKVIQIEQYEDDEYTSLVCVYFKNTKEEVLKLILDEGEGDIELIGDDILFMTNVIFAEVNKKDICTSEINKGTCEYKKCLEDVKKQRGTYPHNTWSNHLKGDSYFYNEIQTKYPKEHISEAVKDCEKIEKSYK